MPKLTLTPDMLESAYEYLRVSPPFCRWGLPHADHVMFRVLRKEAANCREKLFEPVCIDIPIVGCFQN